MERRVKQLHSDKTQNKTGRVLTYHVVEIFILVPGTLLGGELAACNDLYSAVRFTVDATYQSNEKRLGCVKKTFTQF